MNTLKIPYPALTITDEFKSLIRELTYVEKDQLEESIKKDGCLSPIVIWGSKNIILDGHNRYEICTQNKIEFKTVTLEFLDENDAKIWIINNQFSRRNLSNYERSLLALKLDSIIKERAHENQVAALSQSPVHQISDKREKREILNTNKYLSSLAGVSHDTIAKVRKIEKVADDETKTELLKSKRSINEVYQNIKKQEEKEKKVNATVVNPDDENEKHDILYAYYFQFKRTNKAYINKRIKKDAIFFLWTRPEKLDESLKIIKRFEFKYTYCFVWNKSEELNSFELLLIAHRGKPQRKEDVEFIRVYTESPTEKIITPEYYTDLIQRMYPNRKVYNL